MPTIEKPAWKIAVVTTTDSDNGSGNSDDDRSVTKPYPTISANKDIAPKCVVHTRPLDTLTTLKLDQTPKNLLKRIPERFRRVKWSNVIILITMHSLFVSGYIHMMNHSVKMNTVIFASLMGLFTGFGTTVGAHRLWAHRSFKARLPLRLLLALLQAMTMNGSAYSFARDHRTHHKYSDTEGDPKNPSRGLFYSHIGWWMFKKSQTVLEHGNKLDFSDLKRDKVCWYQHRFYTPLFLTFGVTIPLLLPYYCWQEDLLTSFYVCVVIRTMIALHHYSTVNSIAHFFGNRPYDFRMRPCENRLVIYLSMGEGNHNYHHTFPYDYSSSEKKCWEFFNPSTMFIDLNWCLGLAYDLKKASPAAIAGKIRRHGIPAHFDPPRNLLFRICYGISDWIIGLVMVGWVLHPLFLYKYLTNQPLMI